MSATSACPTYEEVSKNFTFPVPRSYYRLLQLAFQWNRDDPWNAFEWCDFMYLDNTHANPIYVYPGHDYPSTPVELYVIGWSGTDGVHYGFLVDDLPTKSQELPIAEVYPADGLCRLLGLTIGEVLSVRIGEMIKDHGAEWHSQHADMILALVNEVSVDLARRPDDVLVSAMAGRMHDGAVFTPIDRCGARVPMHLVDWTYWNKIDWESERYAKDMPEYLLDEAEGRLAKGDHVTAFLIAKNLWMLYWRRPGGEGNIWLRRTGHVMEQAYRTLNRPHLAQKMGTVMNWVLKQVE